MDIRFGYDGWHGYLAHEVTYDRIKAITRASAVVMTRDAGDAPRMVIAFDRRFLSDTFARTIASEVASMGIESWLINVPVPTAILSYTIRTLEAAGGIMVTAGSLPATLSGIKLRASDGAALPAWMYTAIENALDSGTQYSARGPLAHITETDPVSGYLAGLSDRVSLRAIQNSGITVAIDPMFGATSGLIQRLIDGNGSRSVEIRTVHNPLFPGLDAPDPIEPNLASLRRVVSTGGAAFGIALSGDGSSIAVIDDQGRYVSGELSAAVIAHYLLEIRQMRGTLAKSIVCSSLVDRLAAAYEVPVLELGAGFRRTSQAIRDHHLMFAVDEWGGGVYPDHLADRDGLLLAMMLCSYVVETGSTISQLVSDLQEVAGTRSFERRLIQLDADQAGTIEIRINREEWPLQVAGCTVAEVVRTDGIRLEMETGEWLLLRQDDYEPILQIAAEADDDETLQALVEAGRHLMLV